MRFSVQLANGANYIPVPVESKINSLVGVAAATPGAAASITVSHGGTTLGVCTLDGEATGVAVRGVLDATDGRTNVPAVECLVVDCSSSNNVAMALTIDLDEFLVG